MTHSPTPWNYCYDGSSDWTIGETKDPQGFPVCTIWDKKDERAEANAQLICTAVNSYAADQEIKRELVEALKETHSMAHMNCPLDCFFRMLIAKASATK